MQRKAPGSWAPFLYGQARANYRYRFFHLPEGDNGGSAGICRTSCKLHIQTQ